MKKLLFVLTLFFLSVSVSMAQLYEYPLRVAIFGTTIYTYSNSPNSLFRICKYSGTNLDWTYSFNEPGFDDAYIFDLVEGDDGDVYAIGKIKQINEYTTILLKIDGVGNLEWVRYLNYSASEDVGLSIAYSNGEVYFTGFAINVFNQKDAYVNKYTRKGEVSWNRMYKCDLYPEYSDDIGSKILVDENYIYLCGTTNSSNSGTTDIFTVTLAKDGTVADPPRVFETANANEYLTDFIFVSRHSTNTNTAQKNMTAVTLYADNIINNTKDYGVIMFGDMMGSFVEWSKIYNIGNMDDGAVKIMVSNDSNIISTGFVQKSQYNYDFATMKHNKITGAPMWSDSIVYYPPSYGKTNAIDMASALAKHGDTIYVGGFSESAGNQFVIQAINDSQASSTLPLNISYSPNFNADYIPGQYNMKAFLGVDTITGNIIGVFSKANINDELDIEYSVVKFNNTGDVLSEIEVANDEPEQLYNINNNSNQLKVYPNPFNPETSIEFNLPAVSLVNIKIYDISGREVFAMNEQRPAGVNKVSFKANNLASGVYYLKMLIGNKLETKKLILIK